MRVLQAAQICNPFTEGTRPRLLGRGRWCSTASFRHKKLQNVMLRQLPSKTRRQSMFVAGQAQSGSAAEDRASSSQPVLKQSLSKPAVNVGTAGQKPVAAKLGTLWGLLVLSIAYVHHSTTGYVCTLQRLGHQTEPTGSAPLNCRFALPALLPLITPDLHLTEQQGALLTAGYAVSAPTSAV